MSLDPPVRACVMLLLLYEVPTGFLLGLRGPQVDLDSHLASAFEAGWHSPRVPAEGASAILEFVRHRHVSFLMDRDSNRAPARWASGQCSGLPKNLTAWGSAPAGAHGRHNESERGCGPERPARTVVRGNAKSGRAGPRTDRDRCPPGPGTYSGIRLVLATSTGIRRLSHIGICPQRAFLPVHPRFAVPGPAASLRSW